MSTCATRDGLSAASAAAKPRTSSPNSSSWPFGAGHDGRDRAAVARDAMRLLLR